jgi:uncharacterized protein YdhG (YjbR/CyaY superfamily)
MKQFKTIDEYIVHFPAAVGVILKKIRTAIRNAAPKAQEAITYGIPTFTLNGKNLVHFGGFKNHVSFFPTSSGVREFSKELAKYNTSRGTVQFPLGKPIPYGLLARIVKFRVRENLNKYRS